MYFIDVNLERCIDKLYILWFCTSDGSVDANKYEYEYVAWKCFTQEKPNYSVPYVLIICEKVTKLEGGGSSWATFFSAVSPQTVEQKLLAPVWS
jgi:hypothetical protein